MMLKHYLILMLLYSSASANNSFSDHFEYSSSFLPPHADSITQHFTEDESISSKQRLKLYKQFNDDISLQIEQNPNNPILWFSKGLNFTNRLVALEKQKELGARNINALINQTRDYMQKSFLKAMQFDDKTKPKLTARMYGTIKHHLDDDNRIKALQNELSLGGSGDNESHYWFTHWDVIGSLQDRGRFEDAEVALYQLKGELKAAGLENSEFSKVYQQAKTKLTNDRILSKQLEKKITQQYETKGTRHATPKRPLFDTIKSKFETYWFMVLLNAFIFLSLIYAFIKREKDE